MPVIFSRIWKKFIRLFGYIVGAWGAWRFERHYKKYVVGRTIVINGETRTITAYKQGIASVDVPFATKPSSSDSFFLMR